ncbi:MAG: single-stranded DNA-binding protein [Zavarzinella sp.]
MANLNRVILIGRLTRDPEVRTFANGGKVAKFSFAVSGRKKTASGWEDDPMFIDVEVFSRGDYTTLVDTVEQKCQKGTQLCLEGKLLLDKWDDKKTGEKRSKHKVVAENIQLFDPRSAGGGGSGGGYRSMDEDAPPRSGSGFSGSDHADSGGDSDDDIPF